MNPQNKWLKIVGIVLHVLIAGLLIFAGSLLIFGSADPETAKQMGDSKIVDNLNLIGLGELTCAVLLLLPWTSPLGVLITSGLWGGTICFHMSRGENYTLNAALLVVTWLGGYLRGSVPLFSKKLF
jgi:hypothetical protein